MHGTSQPQHNPRAPEEPQPRGQEGTGRGHCLGTQPGRTPGKLPLQGKENSLLSVALRRSSTQRLGWGVRGSSTQTRRAQGASHVSMSPPLMAPVFPAGQGWAPPVSIPAVTFQHLPCASPLESLANKFLVFLPGCGTCPALPGHGAWHKDKGLLLLLPPEPTVPAQCPGLAPRAIPALQWWH